MEKISDIITAINTCHADAIGMKKICEQCPYHSHSNCISDLKKDIAATLKPRVLMPDEVAALPQDTIIYAELRITDKLFPMRRAGNDFISIYNDNDYFLLDEVTESLDYNVHYRFWLGEPSKAYRDFVPWRKNYL